MLEKKSVLYCGGENQYFMFIPLFLKLFSYELGDLGLFLFNLFYHRTSNT